MELDISRHPCFDDKARHKYARVHLPVAPKCNIQCNFCDRQMDCVNESRPGVTSTVLAPHQALAYVDKVLEWNSATAVVGIAGPGDPFANANETMETLRLVKAAHPQMLLCVASNGLEAAPHIEELASLGLSHMTVTINAVDPEIGSKIYAWVRPGKKILRGVEGASMLLERQLEVLRLLKKHGVVAKVNTILMPGVNDHHIEQVARTVHEIGADIHNILPIYPVERTPFGVLSSPTKEELGQARDASGKYMKQMAHCARCRADAVGFLGQPMAQEMLTELKRSSMLPVVKGEPRSLVAVATREGMLVNRHLGEAEQFWVFAQSEDGYKMVEKRNAPPSGGGVERWSALAATLNDCRAVLVAGAGDKPKAVLREAGVEVVLADTLVEEALAAVFAGSAPPQPRTVARCGDSCGGTGGGCG